MNSDPLQGNALFELPALFSPEECATLIRWSEEQGYVEQRGEEELPPSSARCESAEPLPAFVWARLAEGIEASVAGDVAERFSRAPVVYRFDPGQRLPPTAGTLPERVGAIGSRWCVVVYLNEGFTGGETCCYPYEGPVRVAPRRGAALVFPAFLTSEELPVQAGRKSILRAEILLRKKEER
jgi:hypothetical protein